MTKDELQKACKNMLRKIAKLEKKIADMEANPKIKYIQRMPKTTVVEVSNNGIILAEIRAIASIRRGTKDPEYLLNETLSGLQAILQKYGG